MKKKKSRKNIRRMLINSFRTTGVDKIIGAYLIWFLLSAIPLMIFEPSIETYGDSLWFCFASATSIGYGDYSAVTLIGRTITIILAVYSIAVIAIFTAVITSFFTDLVKIRANESAGKFLDDLEHLPELSKEELEDLSKRVTAFRKNRQNNDKVDF